MLGCRLANVYRGVDEFGDGILVVLELEVRSGASGEIGGEFVYRDGTGGGLNVDS